jgi:hypothetical protein
LAALNKHNSNTSLLRSLCAGAFNPQLARIDFPDKKFAPSVSGAVELDPEAKTIKYFNQENGRVFVHPSSTVFDAQGFPGNSVYMSYFNKMATSKVFIRDLTREYFSTLISNHSNSFANTNKPSTPTRPFSSPAPLPLTPSAVALSSTAGSAFEAGRESAS